MKHIGDNSRYDMDAYQAVYVFLMDLCEIQIRRGWKHATIHVQQRLHGSREQRLITALRQQHNILEALRLDIATDNLKGGATVDGHVLVMQEVSACRVLVLCCRFRV